MEHKSISRRHALGLLGTALVAAACSNPEDDKSKVTAPGSGGVDAIELSESGATLPSGEVTLRWTESSQFSKAFLPTFWQAYEKAHSNIKVTYDNLPDDELARVLQLAFQSNDTPDVFRLTNQIIPAAQAVRQQLVMPIDDFVPDFGTWQSAFPPGSFVEGLNVFDGKTYSFPMLGTFTWTLQFNRTYLEQAEVDPTQEALTFDSFRSTAKKLTEQGNGSYYGLVIGGADTERWASLMAILGSLAHADGGEFNYRTGTYNYTSDGFAEVIDLVLALKSDQSIDPSAVTLNSDQARAKLPVGQAAMILNETGVVPFWIAENPDFDFDIANLPVPALDDHGNVGVQPSTSFWWVSAASKNGAVIGDVFSYLGSVAGQKTWQQVGGGSLPVIHAEANDVAGLDPRLRSAYKYFEDIVRIAPSPEAANPDVSLVLQERRAITPDLGSIVQGIYTGQLDDPAKALAQLQSSSERELDRAIQAARAKGAQVSRDDWVFPDWDPTADYVGTK